MQISDLLIQYQNNLSSGSEISSGTKGIEELVETAKQLTVGNIFEGTVNSVRGNQVILGLSSGQNITARLDKGIVLTPGQSVFFQVKANEGSQVRIKPISMQGSAGNPTLTQALEAAGLPVTERNLNMVNAMMKEQMPIDAKSLQDMSRLLLQDKGASPATVVEMTKLQIPLSPGNIMQFESYKEDQGQVIRQMNQLVDEITSMFEQPDLSLEDGVALNRGIVSFFTENATGEMPDMAAQKTQEMAAQKTPDMETAFAAPEARAIPLSPQEAAVLTGRTSVFTQELLPMEEYPADSVGAALEPQEIKEMQVKLSKFPQFIKEYPQYFDENGQWKPETKTGTFLKDLAEFFSASAPSLKREGVMELLSGKAYRHLAEKMMSDQWTLRPEELTEEHSVRDLYQKMEGQLQRLHELVGNYPKVGETVANAAGNLSSNIEFMEQINQLYTYVQIPIKLQGQNINSELYVFRNAKQDKGEDEPLSAFLHFDMQMLGSMDISVKLLHRNVTTNWYLASQEAMEMIEANLPQLTQRLEAKGYQCEMHVETTEKGEKKIDFVEDFLKGNEKRRSDGQVHRYSFDVRA